MNWEIVGEHKKLKKSFEFESFRQSMEFVHKVAELAEEMNHHPDIRISYKQVVLELWTHSAGGVTEKDQNLAIRIDSLFD
jgi:4a-hydroxytetrahydrobiopterin dehydratase